MHNSEFGHSSRGVTLEARRPQSTALAQRDKKRGHQLPRSLPPRPLTEGQGPGAPLHRPSQSAPHPGRHSLGLSAQCSPAPVKASPVSETSQQAAENPASASAASPTPGRARRQCLLKRAPLLPLPCSAGLSVSLRGSGARPALLRPGSAALHLWEAPTSPGRLQGWVTD